MVLSTRGCANTTVETPSGEMTSFRPPRLANAVSDFLKEFRLDDDALNHPSLNTHAEVLQ